jgi:hypothetical protein
VASGRDSAQVAVLEPVAVAFEADDLGVVDEAVDHRGGDDVVAEDLAPAAEGLVGGDDERSALVSGRDELEEQVRGFGLERDVADFVDLCRCPHRSTSSATWNWTAAAPSCCSRS